MNDVYLPFVKEYSGVARPLAVMKRTNRPDRWASLLDEALEEFEELKKWLK